MSQQYSNQPVQGPPQHYPNQPFPPQHGAGGYPPAGPGRPLQQGPKKPNRWVWPVATISALFVGVLIGAAAGGGSDSPASSSSQPTVTTTVPGPAGATVAGPTVTKPGPTVTVTKPGPAKTVTAPPPGPATAISEDGTYLVGTDIKPGTYRNGNEGDCYWERLSNTSGDFDAIIANGNGGNQVVTVKKTDKAFHTERCGEWKKIG